jgi:toxin YoeB
VRINFTATACDEYVDWQQRELDIGFDVTALIAEVRRLPFTGIGKPEPLRDSWQGWWSRRITGKHRLIYAISGTATSSMSRSHSAEVTI